MWLRYMVACFFLNGLAYLAIAMVHQAGYDDQRAAYLFAYFVTALVLALVTIAFRRKRVVLRDLLIGCPMGLLWIACAITTLVALTRIDVSRFFPLTTAGNDVLTCLLSFVFWKEKLNGVLGYAGMAVGVLAIYLLAT